MGWIGAVAAYTPLDVTAATRQDPQALGAGYLGMGLIAGSVIVPLAIASLITGVIMCRPERSGVRSGPGG